MGMVRGGHWHNPDVVRLDAAACGGSEHMCCERRHASGTFLSRDHYRLVSHAALANARLTRAVAARRGCEPAPRCTMSAWPATRRLQVAATDAAREAGYAVYSSQHMIMATSTGAEVEMVKLFFVYMHVANCYWSSGVLRELHARRRLFRLRGDPEAARGAEVEVVSGIAALEQSTSAALFAVVTLYF